MSADTLTAQSRNFYERTKMKLAASLIIGGGGLMMLGLCTSAGGQSASSSELESNANDDHVKNSYQDLTGGFGE